QLAPDLVELASIRGLTGDRAVRQQIARAHINDYMQSQLTKRLVEATMAGQADTTAVSMIKLGLGIMQPLRAATAMEIAGRGGIAWSTEGNAGNNAAVNF